MPETTVATITTNEEAAASLNSADCPACGAGKVPMRSLCGRCFGRLPSPLATALYRKVFEGYLEAVQAALRYLSGDRAAACAAAATCRRCPAPIIFAKQNPTASNPHPSSNPLNAEPSPEGNLLLDLKTLRYDVLTGQTLFEARERGEELYLSHFVNCPNRGQFGKKAHARA